MLVYIKDLETNHVTWSWGTEEDLHWHDILVPRTLRLID